MEAWDNLLIAVDPGHGGYDLGAAYNGRYEKDDNLRLGLAVRDRLLEQGLRVLMTRDTDEFISLQDRASLANEAGADLFVALHRNSYIEQTPSTNGVENFIYLTAPEDTTGRAARLVLDEVASVGVQADRGVKRGNYYVLRRTAMPAMLLELGFIINDEDNRLYDLYLEDYATAIARGILDYFGVPYREPGSTPEPEPPPPGDGSILAQDTAYAQQALNNRFASGLAVDGIYGPLTRKAAVSALQNELNKDFQAGLSVDGIYGPLTRAAMPAVAVGARGGIAYLIQVLLTLNGYGPGAIDGIYGPLTRLAVLTYQRDHYLAADGVAGPDTVGSLVGG